MVTVYYAYYHEPLIEELHLSYIHSLPDVIRENIFKFRRWEDQHSRLFSRLILMQAFKDFNISSDLSLVKNDPLGKPYIDDLNFNISHSGNIVVVAVSNNLYDVGIDIELIDDIQIEDFKNIFTEYEWNDITQASSPINQFFQYWTQKESLIKADGRGLSIPLKKVFINKNKGIIEEKEWYLTRIQIDNSYSCWLAASEEVKLVNFKLINFYI